MPEVKTVTIPPCGHLTCAHGFMGCVYEVRQKIGVIETVPKLPPGSKVHLERVSSTGFPDRDWVTVESPDA